MTETPESALAATHTDPVSGMTVIANAEKSVEQAGVRYYFCSPGCVAKFKAQPDQYLNKPASSAPLTAKAAEQPKAHAGKPVDVDTMYTCPIHPR